MGKERESTKEMRKALISSSIRATKEIMELPKSIEWKTDGAYCTEIMEHILEICERYGMLPTVAHMASAIGVPRDTIDDVRNRIIAANPDVVTVMQQYYSLCENTTVASTLDGGTNNIAGIFILKSQYGYKEEPREVIMTHNKLLGERKDPASIAQRYKDAMVVDAKEVRSVEGSVEEETSTGEYDF